MHLIVPFIACLALFMLFPKGFKYMVGTWLGVCAGGLMWCMLSIVWFHTFFTLGAFAAFMLVGVFGGCVLAAKG